jgi:hypothetical protein
MSEETALQLPPVQDRMKTMARLDPEWGLTKGEIINMLMKSELFGGKGLTFPQAFAKIMIGETLGMNYVQALQMVHVFQGNIQIDYEWIAHCIKTSGCDFRVVEHTTELCRIDFINEKGELVGTNEFTIKDAQRAGLAGKDIWKNYPKTMLFARALTQGQRMYLPQATGNMKVFVQDEIDEMRSRGEMREASANKADELTQQILASSVSAETMSDGTKVNPATGEVITTAEYVPPAEELPVTVGEQDTTLPVTVGTGDGDFSLP